MQPDEDFFDAMDTALGKYMREYRSRDVYDLFLAGANFGMEYTAIKLAGKEMWDESEVYVAEMEAKKEKNGEETNPK